MAIKQSVFFSVLKFSKTFLTNSSVFFSVYYDYDMPTPELMLLFALHTSTTTTRSD